MPIKDNINPCSIYERKGMLNYLSCYYHWSTTHYQRNSYSTIHNQSRWRNVTLHHYNIATDLIAVSSYFSSSFISMLWSSLFNSYIFKYRLIWSIFNPSIQFPPILSSRSLYERQYRNKQPSKNTAASNTQNYTVKSGLSLLQRSNTTLYHIESSKLSYEFDLPVHAPFIGS